jgi:hypothetical protein
MKFGIRDMLLLVTFIAVLLWLFSGNNKIVGRHLLWASLVLASSIGIGLLLTSWSDIRMRCAIGGLLGALVYVLVSWILIDQLIDIPIFDRIALQESRLTIGDASEIRIHTFGIEAICLVPLGIAAGATVGTFLIFALRQTGLGETDRTNRNISAVLLGLVCLAWLLAVIDGWLSNYLDSPWIGICGLLALVFALFTFSWLGDYIKAKSKSAYSQRPGSTTAMPDEAGESRSPGKPD